MKVVESLFKNYLQINPDDYIQKYLSARAVLEITDSRREELKKLDEWSRSLSKKFPVSIHTANQFLRDKATKLTMQHRGVHFVINKTNGDDYRLREEMAMFIEKVNKSVISSMEKYNSDRGRLSSESSNSDFEGLLDE